MITKLMFYTIIIYNIFAIVNIKCLTMFTFYFIIKLDIMRRLDMRSFTNNNPLNIPRTDNRLAGLTAEQTDAKFFQFISPEYGIKAAYDKVRDLNINKHRKTVGAILSMWAPPDTHDTLSYIKFVCTICKCEPEYIVDPADTDFMVKLLGAMIRFENRVCPYTPSILRKGILLNVENAS